jgi:hypothetical protein
MIKIKNKDDYFKNVPKFVLEQLLLSYLTTVEKSKLKESNKEYSKKIQIRPRLDYNTTIRSFLFNLKLCGSNLEEYPVLRNKSLKGYSDFYCPIHPLLKVKMSQNYISSPYGPTLCPVSCGPPSEIIIIPQDKYEESLQAQQIQQLNDYVAKNDAIISCLGEKHSKLPNVDPRVNSSQKSQFSYTFGKTNTMVYKRFKRVKIYSKSRTL